MTATTKEIKHLMSALLWKEIIKQNGLRNIKLLYTHFTTC